VEGGRSGESLGSSKTASPGPHSTPQLIDCRIEGFINPVAMTVGQQADDIVILSAVWPDERKKSTEARLSSPKRRSAWLELQGAELHIEFESHLCSILHDPLQPPRTSDTERLQVGDDLGRLSEPRCEVDLERQRVS